MYKSNYAHNITFVVVMLFGFRENITFANELLIKDLLGLCQSLVFCHVI